MYIAQKKKESLMWKVPVCPYASSPNLFEDFDFKCYWTHKVVGATLAPSCTLQKWLDTQNRSRFRRIRETSTPLDNKIPVIQLVFSHYFDGASLVF
jgi:hypothetical protein